MRKPTLTWKKVSLAKMPYKSKKQQRLAAMAEPRGHITKADLMAVKRKKLAIKKKKNG